MAEETTPSPDPAATNPQTNKRLMERMLAALERPIYQAIPQAQNRSSLTRTLLIILLLGLLGCAIFLIARYYSAPKTVPSVLSRMEGIKRVRELHLVRLHYESVIPITKRKNRDKKNQKEVPQFLLVAPMELSMYVDLGKMKMDLRPDSLVVINLPDPELSKVYINFHEVKEYQMAEGWSLGDIDLSLTYSEVYDDIAYKLTETKDDVRSRASHPSILQDTRAKAENYLRNLLNSLGYRVEFEYPQDEEADQLQEGDIQSQIQDYLKEQNLSSDEMLDQLKLMNRILKN
ncbi:MAG: DUF4230 domain-containing protein [Bacteroidota bacterium]